MMMSHIDLNKEEFEIGQMCEWHPGATMRRSVEVSVVAQYFGEDSITDMGKDQYLTSPAQGEVTCKICPLPSCTDLMKDLLYWVRVQDLTKIIAST